MKNTDFDSIIKQVVSVDFKELSNDFGPNSWLWIKAQIWQESDFDPHAVSAVGARGLMQLMPSTAEYVGVKDIFNPRENITGGVKYLREQYVHLAEIPGKRSRLKFAFASYNGGRGYINMALQLSRQHCNAPATYAAWVAQGKPSGIWQDYGYSSRFLASKSCVVNQKRPDADQILDYVEKICQKHKVLRRELS